MLPVFAAALLAVLPAQGPAPAAKPVTTSSAAVGTPVIHQQRTSDGAVVDILVAGSDAAAVDAAVNAAVVEIARVQSLFSSTSGALSALRSAAGEAVTVDPEIFAVLVEVQRISKLAKGGFDPTVAAYADVWAFDVAVDGPRPVPAPELLAERKGLVGVDVLVLDPVRRTVRLKAAGAASTSPTS